MKTAVLVGQGCQDADVVGGQGWFLFEKFSKIGQLLPKSSFGKGILVLERTVKNLVDVLGRQAAAGEFSGIIRDEDGVFIIVGFTFKREGLSDLFLSIVDDVKSGLLDHGIDLGKNVEGVAKDVTGIVNHFPDTFITPSDIHHIFD